MKIIILSILLMINKSYIILPFKTQINETQLKKDFISSKFYNDIYVNIKVGSNKQEIPIQIRLHSYSFYIINDLYDGEYKIQKYESSKSKTYESLKKLDSLFYSDDFTRGSISTETFYFNNLKINNLTFISADFVVKFHHITQSGVIGLNLKQYEKKLVEEGNLLNELKKLNLIKKDIFSINYINDNEGYFIIGEELHNTKESTYTENSYKLYKLPNNFFHNEWKIQFDLYKFGNDKIEYNINSLFYPEIGFIISNSGYLKLVENFFKKYDNICSKKDFYQISFYENYLGISYDYFVCEKEFNEMEFPSLFFESKKLNLTYEINYKDIWTEYNGKKYFLIIFPEKDIDGIDFILGKPFIRKYDFSFEIENKIIYAYDINSPRYNKKWKYFWFWMKVLIFILIILIIILGIYAYYMKLKIPRKKRAYEIEDNFNYLPSNNDIKLLN